MWEKNADLLPLIKKRQGMKILLPANITQMLMQQ
jgi:hypothetical protein